MKIYPYSRSSESAKSLADFLKCKRVRPDGKGFVRDRIVINWGASRIARDIGYALMLNEPEAVARAVNKLETFKALQGTVPIPEWTEDATEAAKWLAKHSVVARTVLTGHSGKGIHIIEEGELPKAKLYVKYIPKKDEYRLHVFMGEVFFVQRKARNKAVNDEKVNWKVRNHRNGFIYAHKDVDVSDEAKQAAIMAVDALGLDFGAVDMIYNEKQNKYFVLEVNTACGLHGETLSKYGEKFAQFK